MAGREDTDDAQQTLAQLIRAGFPFEPGAAPAPDVHPADWSRVARAAAHHGLAPLLYAALRAGARLESLPPAVRDRLRTAYLLTSTANWMAYGDLERLLEALAAEKVPAVLLKGCALAATLYPEAALRPMGDLDLLVPRSGLEQLRAVMAAQGYRPMQEMADDFGRRYLQEQIYLRGGSRPAQVDAHWHLTSMPYYRARIPIEWFWERAVERPVNGRPALVFTPEAQLLHLSLHFALHHQTNRLLWSYDLALLLARYGGTLDWVAAAGAIETFGLSQAVLSSLAQVRQWWGVSPPAEATAWLRAIRPRLSERLLTAVMSARRREARVLTDGMSLPGLRPKLGYWLGLVFPDAAYMRRRYRFQHAALAPVYYAVRIGGGLWQLARSAIAIGVGAVRARASN